MKPLQYSILICIVLLATNGCNRQRPKPEVGEAKGSTVEMRSLGGTFPPPVTFDIRGSETNFGPGRGQDCECTYVADGMTAKFLLRLKFDAIQNFEGLLIANGEGKFIASKGSENSVLLKHLKSALEAKTMPASVQRTEELAFDAVILGQHQSRNAARGYASSPAGDWTAMKLFLPKGDDEGQVFLNLNVVLGKAEFSIKDSDYGDYLLEQFAKVL